MAKHVKIDIRYKEDSILPKEIELKDFEDVVFYDENGYILDSEIKELKHDGNGSYELIIKTSKSDQFKLK